jgi:hypothetical protein
MPRDKPRDLASTTSAHPAPSSAPEALPPIPWSSLVIRVVTRAPSGKRDVTGPHRLALLYLWHRDDRSPHVASAEVAFHSLRGASLASPREVDWAGFPWGDAVTAVSAMGTRQRIPTPLAMKVRRPI